LARWQLLTATPAPADPEVRRAGVEPTHRVVIHRGADLDLDEDAALAGDDEQVDFFSPVPYSAGTESSAQSGPRAGTVSVPWGERPSPGQHGSARALTAAPESAAGAWAEFGGKRASALTGQG
jgi:hypothetical protein